MAYADRFPQMVDDGLHVDVNALKKGEVSLGTSIMAITFKDGVILGADSRTSSGTYVSNRTSDKLTQVHDTVWCCRAGSAADTQAVADVVRYQLDLFGIAHNMPVTTQTAASMFQEVLYQNRDSLGAGIILAGWDAAHGGQVYELPLGGSLHRGPYMIAGSGSSYIRGFCAANWREAMDEADAVAFVKSALTQAIRWDGNSGGVIRLVVMTPAGAVRHTYLPDEGYAKRH